MFVPVISAMGNSFLQVCGQAARGHHDGGHRALDVSWFKTVGQSAIGSQHSTNSLPERRGRERGQLPL